jgi:hypothetical protein
MLCDRVHTSGPSLAFNYLPKFDFLNKRAKNEENHPIRKLSGFFEVSRDSSSTQKGNRSRV